MPAFDRGFWLLRCQQQGITANEPNPRKYLPCKFHSENFTCRNDAAACKFSHHPSILYKSVEQQKDELQRLFAEREELRLWALAYGKLSPSMQAFVLKLQEGRKRESAMTAAPNPTPKTTESLVPHREQGWRHWPPDLREKHSAVQHVQSEQLHAQHYLNLLVYEEWARNESLQVPPDLQKQTVLFCPFYPAGEKQVVARNGYFFALFTTSQWEQVEPKMDAQVEVQHLQLDGTVVHVSPKACVVELRRVDAIPEKSRMEANVKFFTNASKFERMRWAMKTVHPKVLMPGPAPLWRLQGTQFFFNKELNEKQRLAVSGVLNRFTMFGISAIVGCSGTGKTEAMFEILRQYFETEAHDQGTVIIATHTSTCADSYAARWLDLNNDISMVRVYDNTRRPDTVPPMLQRAAAFEPGPGETDASFVDRVTQAKIVVLTMGTAYSLRNTRLNIPLILVDEAAQAMEPEALIPLCLADPNYTKHIVLAGDPLQADATVLCEEASLLRLSLLERLMERSGPSPMSISLTTNYRNHPDIVRFLSSSLYSDVDFRPDVDQRPAFTPEFQSRRCGLHFVHVEEQQATNQFGADLTAAQTEANGVVAACAEFVEQGLEQSQLAVIASQPAQIQLLREALKQRGLALVPVLSVQASRGQSFDVVVLSTRASSSESDAGLVRDDGFIATALTRAKQAVVAVGDHNLLEQQNSTWHDYLSFCRQNQTLHRYPFQPNPVAFPDSSTFSSAPSTSRTTPTQLLLDDPLSQPAVGVAAPSSSSVVGRSLWDDSPASLGALGQPSATATNPSIASYWQQPDVSAWKPTEPQTNGWGTSTAAASLPAAGTSADIHLVKAAMQLQEASQLLLNAICQPDTADNAVERVKFNLLSIRDELNKRR